MGGAAPAGGTALAAGAPPPGAGAGGGGRRRHTPRLRPRRRRVDEDAAAGALGQSNLWLPRVAFGGRDPDLPDAALLVQHPSHVLVQPPKLVLSACLNEGLVGRRVRRAMHEGRDGHRVLPQDAAAFVSLPVVPQREDRRRRIRIVRVPVPIVPTKARVLQSQPRAAPDPVRHAVEPVAPSQDAEIRRRCGRAGAEDRHAGMDLVQSPIALLHRLRGGPGERSAAGR
mmetsp:Transcript_118077/g.328265  ORF Transcript_118077/g.328265 Transcript_118077/m.328265 type:complete len:227 (-) Transcript_118077:66-746(-)